MWCTMTVSVAEPVYGTEVIRVLVPGDEEDLDEYEVAAALQAAQDSITNCKACCGKRRAHTCVVTKPVVTKPAVSEPAVDLSQWRSDKCSSGYTNVYKRKRNGRFEACPVFNGKKH